MNLIELCRAIFAPLRKQRGSVALLLLITTTGALLTGVGDPLFMKLLIDSLARRDTRSFVMIAVGLILLYTLLRLANLFAALLTQRLKNRICESLTLQTLGAFYRTPYGEVVQRDNGYFISRIYDEPARITDAVNLACDLWASSIALIGATAVCLWLSWEVAVILSVAVPALLYVSGRYSARIKSAAIQEQEEQARLREGFGRAVESYKTVNVFGLQAAVERKVVSLLESYLGVLYRRVRFSASFQTASGIFLSYAEAAVLIGAGWQVLAGKLTVGGLFGFTSAYWRVVNSFRTLTSLMPQIATLAGQVSRLDEFNAAPARPAATASGGALSLRDVGFSYAGKTILKNFSLDLRPGDRVLVTGPNGSGKTTITHILSGFLEAEGGESVIPPIGRLSCLLLPFGFIPGSLRDNLCLDELGPERRSRAERLAAILGLDGRLEQDPGDLSEGERRKFEILMTLVKEADFYLLDEPLASIDTASKEVVMDAIFEATSGKALLVILHGDERFYDRFDRRIDISDLALGEGPGWAARIAG